MKSFLNKLIDGKDRSAELHYLLVIVAFLALLAFETMNILSGNTFDASSFGEAVGVILGGGGIAAIGQAILNKGN